MQMPDNRFDIKWTCPVCGKDNVDNFEKTYMPFCDGCTKVLFWEDLLTDQQIDLLNELKK